MEIQIFDILRWFSELHPDEFWYHLGGVTQSLGSVKVSLGPQQSGVTFLPKYRIKILGSERFIFIRFNQLFMVSWEP